MANQKTSIYNLNIAGGAMTLIRCSFMTRRMEIVEDASANAGVKQGLIWNQLDPTTNTTGPTLQSAGTDEPIVLADVPGDHGALGQPIGNGGSSPYPCGPGGRVTLGTAVIQLTSATATATKIRVTEWN